jgi:hypothetical protein
MREESTNGERTAEIIAEAHMDANKAIFQNETAVYHMVVGLRKRLDLPTAKITGGKYGIGTATLGTVGGRAHG